MSERCEVCDRPRATDEQWRDVPPGERDDLCWGREQCEAGAVDWRARTELARIDLAAATARAERAEAGLAALREASRSVVHVAVVPYSDKGNALLQAFDKVIADTAAAAEAYRARIAEETAAPWKAALDAARRELQRTLDERDTLAAALAEVRRAILDGRAAVEVAVRDKGQTLDVVVDAAEAGIADLDRVLAALPADIAAERDRRVRAEALEAAADAIERGSVLSQYGAHGWLRARAADERGGR